MKIPRSLYTILQYISTIDDIFAYTGNGYIIAKDKVGSGFVEIKAPDYFVKEQLVIRSLSKFLRLFTYDKKDKSADPLSIQDFSIVKTMNMAGTGTLGEICITSPGRMIKIKQGLRKFIENRANDLVSKVDSITFEDSIKFQITSALYKQIISDCSLLDLDTLTIVSENDDLIKIYLSNTSNQSNSDTSSFEVECHHKHVSLKIKINLSAFSLIEATDHQLEFGNFLNKYGSYSKVLKVKSFCDNGFIVNRVIVGE